MLREVLKESSGQDEILVAKRIEAAMVNLDEASKLAKKLKDGSRLKKELDKIGGELSEEMMFVQRGEYS